MKKSYAHQINYKLFLIENWGCFGPLVKYLIGTHKKLCI